MQDAFISVSWAPILVLLRDLGQQVTPFPPLGLFPPLYRKSLDLQGFSVLTWGGMGLVSLTRVASPQWAVFLFSPHSHPLP